jgi:hypothetical protein
MNNEEAQRDALGTSGLTFLAGAIAQTMNKLSSEDLIAHWATPKTTIWSERDPNGLDPHAPGAKLDAGKTRPSLIITQMSRALMEVAKVGTYGANKYTDGGWQSVENGVARYTDAMDRHRLKENIEECDEDTALLHAAHLAWNALARLELMLREQESKNA